MPADLDTRTARLYAPEGEVLPAPDDGCVTADADVFAQSRERFEALISFLGGSQSSALEHAELEARLERDARELVCGLLQDHLTVRELGERRLDGVTDSGGVCHRHREAGHERPLATVFGQVRVRRIAYRAPSERNLCPADAVLNLPAERHSHGLRRLACIESARGSFEDAVAAIERGTGQRLGKRQVEQLAARAAVDFDAFYAQRQLTAAAGDVLVVSCDGKGVVMRPGALRAQTARAAACAENKLRTRLSKGEKRNRKRMAEVGAVYDLEPVPRTAADILPAAADTEHSSSPAGPRAANKWLTASITHDAARVVAEIFDEAQRRDPDHARTWVALVDGNNHQIRRIRAEAHARGTPVNIIVDIVHVIEYLWKAAWSLHTEADPAAETWVRRHLTQILDGRARKVAGNIRRQATNAGLDTRQRIGADECAKYLTNKAPFLDYPTALTNGWPIATGIIEGACRHLVKDRMDITGARWGLPGAEAVLKLRAIACNDDFDAYWTFHLAQEHQRVHQSRYADGMISTT